MMEAGQRTADEVLMDRAIDLALRGWGQVSPNPLVGAVLVRGDQVIGEGFHASYGEDHAEVVALRQARTGAVDGTLYVTLEPCTHHGKTPPCTEAILRAGICRVVYACSDPDPQASGGADRLREAGLTVTAGIRSQAAARINGPFIWDRLGDGPWVSLKLGLSLDGRISARKGVRTQITGAESAGYVHRLRAAHDAIVIGGRTACIDDPLLTVRQARAPRVPPLRVVLDPVLDLPVGSRLVQSVAEAPLVIMCSQAAPSDRRSELERRGAEVVAVTGGREGLSLPSVLRQLETRGLQSVLVEGGGRLASAFLAEGLVRAQHLIYAPIVLGAEGVAAFGAPAAGEAGEWSLVRRAGLGEDTLLELEDRRARDALRKVA